MNARNKIIVTEFIEAAWNNSQLDKMDEYLSADFKDHSLPPNLPADTHGTKLWIAGTGKSFEHKTHIEEIICEDDKVMLKIRMQLKHIGIWRGIEPTYFEIATIGYRYFKLADDKIVEHWALIDGNAIENQLRETSAGCKIQE